MSFLSLVTMPGAGGWSPVAAAHSSSLQYSDPLLLSPLDCRDTVRDPDLSLQTLIKSDLSQMSAARLGWKCEVDYLLPLRPLSMRPPVMAIRKALPDCSSLPARLPVRS